MGGIKRYDTVGCGLCGVSQSALTVRGEAIKCLTGRRWPGVGGGAAAVGQPNVPATRVV